MQKSHGTSAPAPGGSALTKALKNRLNVSALESRDFRRLLVGNAASLQGFWIQRLTVAWLAWDMTGQAGFVGWVAFLGFAPTLVTGPLFGVLADRVPLVRAAQATQSSLALVMLATAVAYFAGVLTPTLLAILSLLMGLGISAHHPVRLSLAPLLVPRGDIPSVVALTALNFNLARTIGPAVGGLLIAAFGPGAAMVVSILTYAPLLLILGSLHPRDRDGPRRESVLASLKGGAAMAWRTDVIRTTMALTLIFALIGRGILELLPVIADGVFERGAAGVGTLTSAAGLGALAAAFAVVLLPAVTPGRIPRAGLVALVVGLCATGAASNSDSWPLTLALIAVIGACGTAVGVSMQSTIQMVVAEAYRGRVMSLWIMTGVGGSALGALLLGWMTDAVGLSVAGLVVNGAGLAVFVALFRRGL